MSLSLRWYAHRDLRALLLFVVFLGVLSISAKIGAKLIAQEKTIEISAQEIESGGMEDGQGRDLLFSYDYTITWVWYPSFSLERDGYWRAKVIVVARMGGYIVAGNSDLSAKVYCGYSELRKRWRGSV